MGVASLKVEFALEGDSAGLVELLDRVFVAPQQRAPSFGQRFPSALACGDGAQAWVIKEQGAVVACVLVKRRQWLVLNRSIELVMVGGVCTDPALRGLGMASQLLTHVEVVERQRHQGPMVLWTNSMPFYERLGWQAQDAGLLGILQDGRGWHRGGVDELWVGSPSASLDRLERIRRQWLFSGVVRQASDYAAIPFPARSVDCLIASDGGAAAYALVGRDEQCGYVYETVGDPSVLEPLWAAIRDRYGTVWINEHAEGPMKWWLNRHASVEWQLKPLAMWSGGPRAYVPYFDRI